MDALLSKLSYHATSYAIRSCLALTSTYVIQQGSRLLKTVNDDPLRAELGALQRRLARKIELISPILESIEFRYTRGNSALEAVVRTARELREDIDALAERLEAAAILEERFKDGRNNSSSPESHAELLFILAEMKQLIVSIDDSIPLINLWVSAIGGIQTQPAGFSPSRLLQASMLVNVGDTQYVIDPSKPMQIGPNFTLSLYMLFRGHSSNDGEPYGVEDGQRKPTWQEVIHKARVRLYRVPPAIQYPGIDSDIDPDTPSLAYAYHLQIVEDLEDDRVHTFEDGNIRPGSYDGVSLAGIRELVPVGQIAKMFYADVGRILNINNDDGASSNPVLLLKRDVHVMSPGMTDPIGDNQQPDADLKHVSDIQSVSSGDTLPETDPQDEINRQIRDESQGLNNISAHVSRTTGFQSSQYRNHMPSFSWSLPHDLDPTWMALEVFEIDDSISTDEEESLLPEEEGLPSGRPRRLQATPRPSVDSNLITQLYRMSLASSSSLPSSRPPSSHSPPLAHSPSPQPVSTDISKHQPMTTATVKPDVIEHSPFNAIKTSLSLLEMLLRLTSLQEFEQTTHLAIPDHVLKFYLDESASESGLHGKERWAARAEAERKVGFDPYSDSPGAEDPL